MDSSSSDEPGGLNELVRLLMRRQAYGDALFGFSQATSPSHFSEAAVFEMFATVLKRHLKVDRLRLIIFEDDSWRILVDYGCSTLSPDQQLELFAKIKHYKEFTVLDSPPEKHFADHNILIPVVYNEQRHAYVLIGYTVGEHIHTDANFIETSLNVIMGAMENKRLFNEHLDQEKLKQEIELAKQVQLMLMPQSLPVNKRIEMNAVYLPHHSIGGDYYDFIDLAENQFLFCIGDVTGKGFGAAMLMASVQATIRALVHYEVSLSKLVDDLNSRLFALTKGERCVTLFVGLLDTQSCKLQYINAGHHPPIISRGTCIQTLELGTSVLGGLDNLAFLNFGETEVEPGSLIFCYTDGVVEFAEDEYLLDIDGLKDLVQVHNEDSPKELNQRVIRDIQEKTGREQFEDDITLLTLRFA